MPIIYARGVYDISNISRLQYMPDDGLPVQMKILTLFDKRSWSYSVYQLFPLVPGNILKIIKALIQYNKKEHNKSIELRLVLF